MRKITKKTIKRIKAGHHDDLMEAVEFLLDTYKEDKFDLGYRSCLDDLSVRSQRLAEYIQKNHIKGSTSLVKAIEDYFNEALKE